MPEGHLVHRYAAEQRAALAGRRVEVTSPQGRFVTEAASLDGATLVNVDAHGKHLFYEFDEERVVHVHLGTTGLFLRHARPAPGPRPQVRLRLAAEDAAFDLIAPATCALVNGAARSAIRSRLGPDPLRDDADRERAIRAIRASDAPIGTLLLDQSVVAGAGNVLRAEVLNIRGIHPQRSGRSLSRDEVVGIWDELAHVMRTARDDGVISTRRPAHGGTGRRAQADARFVYDRERCGRCATPVKTLRLGGRPIAFCPRCQPRSGQMEAVGIARTTSGRRTQA